MNEYYVPVTWQMMSILKVKANSLEEAIDIARDDKGIIPIPEDGDFVDGSWELDMDESEIGAISDLYNQGRM